MSNIKEVFENLLKKRRMALLAGKIENEGLSVQEIVQEINGLSRLEREFLYSLLSEKGVSRYSWALDKMLKARRDGLTASIENRSTDFYLSQFGWLEKLELLDEKKVEANGIIKKAVVENIGADEPSAEFVEVVKRVNGEGYASQSVQRMVSRFRKCEKQAVLDIYETAISSGEPVSVLRGLKKNLSAFSLFDNFPSGEVIYKIVIENVRKSIGPENESFGVFESDEDEIYGIAMNVESASMITNSLLASSPSVAFLIELINFFQELQISNDEDETVYDFVSHSLTLFYIKMLEKRGIINIKRVWDDGYLELENYYLALCNDREHRPIKCYNVRFVKNRDLNVFDVEMIRQMMKTFKLPEWEIGFNFDTPKMTAQLSPYAVKTGLFRGPFEERLNKLLNPDMEKDNILKMKETSKK